MRFRRPTVLALLALAACSRDLELPRQNALAFAQPLLEAAPRERLTLRAVGGAGAYRFSFAEGGRLSGADATLDPATGEYQAGRDGSAQDLVLVTDGAGTSATARVSVRARLGATPPIGGTSPGGTLVFTATGGKPPYAFALAAGGSGGGVTQSGASAHYTAGAEGDVTDAIRVTDATGDPAALTTIEIRVGTRLGAFASARAVAPHDTATVVGYGGQPPYAYGISLDASGLATISSTGLYRAGGTGSVVDVVEVRDAHGQRATLQMAVGAALSLVLEGTPPDPRPGVPLRLLAGGGKPPYVYRFAALGNRSGGSVDQTTGTYVPGAAAGAVDLLEVTDQTGLALAAAANPTAIGARRIAVGPTNRSCAAGDLDGDGAGDLLVGNDGFARMAGALRISTAGPRLDVYQVDAGSAAAFTAVEDLDRDARAEVFVSVPDGPIRSFVPDLLGQLSEGPSLESLRPGLVVHVRDGAEDRFLTTSDGGPANGCPAGTAVELRWDPSAFTTLCTAAPGWFAGGGWSTIGLAAGDVDGDGFVDVLQLRAPPAQQTGDADRKLYVAWGKADGSFEPVAVATMAGGEDLIPAQLGWASWRDFGTPYVRFHAVPALAPEGGAPAHAGGVLLRVEDAFGRGWVLTARVERSGPVRTWTRNGAQLHGRSPRLHGLVRAPRSSLPGSETLYVGYNLADGELLGLALDPTSLTPAEVTLQAGPRASRVDCVAFPDANADGAADLVAVGQFLQSADLLLGSGASTEPRAPSAPRFDDRVHLRGLGFPAGVGDADGDGVVELLAWDGAGFSGYRARDGQLGFAQRISTVVPLGATSGPLFGPDPVTTVLVFHDHQQGFYVVEPDGQGGFSPPYLASVTWAPSSGTGAFTEQVFWLGHVEVGAPAVAAAFRLFFADGRGLRAVGMALHPTLRFDRAWERCAFAPAERYPRGAPTARMLMACAEPRAGSPNDTSVDLAVYASTLTGVGTPDPRFSGWTRIDLWENPDLSEEVLVWQNAPLLDGRPAFVAWAPAASAFRVITADAAATVAATEVVPWPGGVADRTFGPALRAPLRSPADPDDLLLTTPRGLVLLRRAAAGSPLEVVQELRGGVQMAVGVGRLAPGAPPVVFTVGAGIFAGETGSELVLVETSEGFLR